IRRFIDTEAAILYVPTDQVLSVAAAEGARSFDASGAEYTHRDGKCSFEVLIEDFGLGGERALARLAKIVHAADIEAELGTDDSAPGLLAIGVGGLDVEADDHRLLERASFVYDALYAWCARQVAAATP
ncbi:MAG: chromate resistance protein, partial [Actinobacteria bacterium]